MFLCRITTFITAYLIVWCVLIQLLSLAILSFGMDLFLLICCLTLATCTKERVVEWTESTYEDMPITSLEKAEKRAGKRGTTGASPTSIWKENTFLSDSLPVCRISVFESGIGQTPTWRWWIYNKPTHLPSNDTKYNVCSLRCAGNIPYP